MTHYTQDKLTDLGYTIENALIEKVDLSMADHGCLTLAMTLVGNGWGVVYGGYTLGCGYLGADDNYFSGSDKGTEYLMRIMDTVGVSSFQDLKGKYLRVAFKRERGGYPVKIVGNILKDKWFDAETFFTDKKENDQ